MEKYLFTVITPFHNVDMNMFNRSADYMERQTVGFENVEWIIVCHNCDDEHLKAVKERVGSYKNVVIRELNNDIYTPSSPRNYGLDLATADYLGFLDGDDNYRIDAIENILDAFEKSGAQSVAFRREYTLEKKELTPITETVNWNQASKMIVINKDSFLNSGKYNDFPFFITSRAYNRLFLEKFNIRFDESVTIAEDAYFNLEVIMHADTLCYSPQLIGYNYFINSGSMLSSSKSDDELISMIISAEKIFDRAYDYGIYPNLIIKMLCFVLSRYAADPNVSIEVKKEMRNRLGDYLNHTVPIPEGRFPEPMNTQINTLPQQIFSSISDNKAFDLSRNGVMFLMGILGENKQTDYGKKYHFEDIVTPRGYQSRVPITEYKDYAPMIDLAVSIGEKNIITAAPVVWYAMNHEGKYLPVTERQYKEFARNFSQNVKGSNVFVWYNNIYTPTVFNDGVTASSVIKMSLASYLDSYRYNGEVQPAAFTSPDFVYFLNNENKEDVEYINMLLALANRNVDQLISPSASEASLLFECMVENADRLCRDLERGEVSGEIPLSDLQRKQIRGYLTPDRERAEEVRQILSDPGREKIGIRLWPKLKNITCVATGIHSAFKENIKKYFGDVCHTNGGIISHSGVFGEAIEDTDQYKLVTGTCFYEFMEKGKEAEKPVFQNGLEVGKEYKIIVTTPSGLYRFMTNISIRVSEIKEGETIFTVV